mgnify:CR=1 FL=1|jgi:hypothetical protein
MGVAAWSIAQSAPTLDTYWTVGAGAISTQKWLGSADIRRGGHYFVTYNRPEPRFAFQNRPGTMSLMGYYTVHKGGGFFGQPFNALHAWGVLMTARYWNRDNRALPTFYEVGWGLHFGNRWIEDIDTPIASTPTLGAGVLVQFGEQEGIFAVRWMHVSNAGTGFRNRGQNGLIFTFELKF